MDFLSSATHRQIGGGADMMSNSNFHSNSLSSTCNKRDIENLLSILDTAEEVATAPAGGYQATAPSSINFSLLEPTPIRPDREMAIRQQQMYQKHHQFMPQFQLPQQQQHMQQPMHMQQGPAPGVSMNSLSNLLSSHLEDEPLNLEEAILAPMIAGNMMGDAPKCHAYNNNNDLFVERSASTTTHHAFPEDPFQHDNGDDDIFANITPVDLCEDNGPEQQRPHQEQPQLAAPAPVASSVVSNSHTGGAAAAGGNAVVRFRKYQTCQWKERFQELMEFRREHGHLLVPHSYPPNQKLAQWVKRQRHQYKRKKLGHHSTLTDEREELLLDVGFIFDSHRAVWYARFETLKAFSLANGHCTIPSKYDDGSLNVWIKHQRRQYLLYKKGAKSTMTEDRIRALDSIGFDWNPRNLIKTCNVGN